MKEKIKNYIQDKFDIIPLVSMIPMGGVVISITDNNYDKINDYWQSLTTLPEDIHDILDSSGLHTVIVEMEYQAEEEGEEPYFIFSIIIRTN